MNIKKILCIIPLMIISLTIHLSAMEIIIQSSVDETYDDNVNTSSDNPESDWLTNIMLGITARSEIRAFDLDLSGHIYQQLSANHSENNSNSQDIVFSLNKDFSENISFGIGDVFYHYPEAGSFGVLFGRAEDNTGYISNTLSVNLLVNVTAKSFLFGLYNNGIMNNDSDQLSDTVMHNGSGGIGYSFNTANIIRFGYSYQLMKYDNGETNRADRGYAEYEKYLTRQLRAVLLGGYDYIDSDAGQSLNTRWMVSLIDDVDRNNQLHISYVKESTISNIINDILNNWTISMSLTRETSERTGIDISLFYGEGTYQNSGITDKLFGASVSLAYIVTEFVNFNTGYRFTWNGSAVPGSEEMTYNRNEFSVGLSAVY